MRSDFRVNRVVLFLTYSDILLLSGWGLVQPILAIFLSEKIKGGGVELAGIAMTVYYLTKSVAQLPIAKIIDSTKGESDDYWLMVAGSLLTAVAAFLYMGVTLPWQVILIQIVHGLGGALCYPTWMAIFTRHIDKNREGWEWTMYFTSTDIGTALAAGLGGFLVATMGYNMVFWIVGITCLIGVVLLTVVRSEIESWKRE